jgi:hypothetical protein
MASWTKSGSYGSSTQWLSSWNNQQLVDELCEDLSEDRLGWDILVSGRIGSSDAEWNMKTFRIIKRRCDKNLVLNVISMMGELRNV